MSSNPTASGNQLRLNPLTGRWVAVAAERSSRPGDFAAPDAPPDTEGERSCPFCPGNEEATPPALETYGGRGEWLLRVVPNKYPAFEGPDALAVESLGPLFTRAPASGIHEVYVFSRDHTATFADLDDPQAGLVMAALRDRMEDHAANRDLRYTQAIVNHGREAGASLPHPHGQLLGIPFVPAEVTDETRGFARFTSGCVLCATVAAERDAAHRVVIDTGEVTVLCPWWSGTPYELLVIPTAHRGHLVAAEPPEVVAVGRALRDALARLRATVGDVAYNLVVHTLPHAHTDIFHWHVHVLPRLASEGGFEQGTGVPVNIVAPEVAAATLAGGPS